MPLKNTKAPKALAAKLLTAKAKALALAQTHFLIQRGDCLLCGKKLSANSEVVIDTVPWDKRIVRGLLHRDCKSLLALESPAMLRKLKAYLACDRLDFLPKQIKAEQADARTHR
jgi:hypothetical protein